jgi:single-strand DNA-binding protein
MQSGIEAALTGRVISSAIELKTSAKGNIWTKFAVSTGQEEGVGIVQIAAFGEVAQAVAAAATKGTRLYVEGTLRLEHWRSRDGQEKSGLALAAWRVEILGQIGKRRVSKEMGARMQAPLDHHVREPAREPAEADEFAA